MAGSVIVAGARTPMGRMSGSLKDFSGSDLGGFAIKGALEKAGVAADQVDSLFFTGGSSSIPALREAVSRCAPQARCVSGDSFGSIGSGLAITARHRYG